ncbi:hypothetical protein O181_005848 [Austropuccinia psidii MF-1]|uniref:Uncharacterized protein n=1 Tax=Austropuccinia psidii MF-1 TaxID=1389203 RepID=A0A9Q3GFZ2_9BASI|nr:hypothetical protein [Austropuccinia psidii MF-1]
MLGTQTEDSSDLCFHHQKIFRQKMGNLKSSHWRYFLAKNGLKRTDQAYKFTKEHLINVTFPLYRQDGSLTTLISEKEMILFEATSIVMAEADLGGIPAGTDSKFPRVSKDEVRTTIQNLPKNKSTSPGTIPNELLKIAIDLLTPHLAELYNACLTHSYFPLQ